MPPEPGGIIFELKRRNVFKVGVLYVIIAWLLLQVADIIMPALDIPDWGIRLVLVLLILGFPLAIFFAWAYEVTPEGLKKEHEVDRNQSITHKTGRKLDIIIICFLLVAVVLLVLDNYVFDTAKETETTVSDMTGKSLAVLPFVNMSDDPGNEYFSDGLAEELLNVLVRVEGIRVASRTSSFQFKGQEIGIPEIARELKVNHIVEGSVRKAGNRVRVTAQLIDVADDRHLWSKTYERELEDIFAIQDEIAEKIVEALKIALGGDETQALAQSRRQTDNLEAFELYLRGKHLWRQRNADAIEKSIETLEQAVAIDPEFARGYVTLALAWAVTPSYSSDVDYHYAFSKAENYSRQALEIDDSLADAYATLALIAETRKQWTAAEDGYTRAIRLQPNEATPHHWYAITLFRTGKVDEALAHILRAYELDPGNGSITGWMGIIHLAHDDADKALEFFDRAADIGWHYALGYSRFARIRIGEFDRAEADYASYLTKTDTGLSADYASKLVEAIASRDTGYIPELPASAGSLRRDVLPLLIEDLILLGQYDKTCELIIDSEERIAITAMAIVWTPLGQGYRKSDCFKDVVEQKRLVDYWRERGWPDFCRPKGDSFECT